VLSFLLSENASADELARQKLVEKCRAPSAEFPKVFQEGSDSALTDDFSPDLRCPRNAANDPNSHNGIAAAGVVSSYRTAFDPGSVDQNLLSTLKGKGVCRLIYEGIAVTYKRMADVKADYCERASTTLQAAIDCGETKECVAQWKEAIRLQQLYDKIVGGQSAAYAAHLDALKQAAGKAAEAYESDQKKLLPFMTSPTARAAAVAADTGVESLPEDQTVKATNGGANVRTLHDYFDALGGKSDITSTPGPLLAEERKARETVGKFSTALKTEVQRARNNSNDFVRQWQTMIDRVNKNGPADPTANLTNLADQTTKLTGLAGPAAQLFSNPAANQMLSRPPLAELAAASAVGAIAAHSLGSSSSGSSGSMPILQGPANVAVLGSPAAAGTDSVPLGNGSPNRATNDLGNPFSANGIKADAKVDDAAGYAPPATLDGSSRALASKKGTRGGGEAPGGGSGAAVDSGGGPKLDEMGAFKANLTPKPASGPPSTNTGNEVANLLGQMKNLFNFDEGLPTGANPATPPSMGGGPGGGEGGSVTAPVGDETGEQQVAGEEGAADAEGVAEGDPENPYDDGDRVQASQYGRADVTLFSRVRERHHQAMKRGLVLYGLRERME
jgi:hypothetical protein